MWTNACLSAIVCTNAKIPLADITVNAMHTLRWIRKIQRTAYVSTCISPIPGMLSYLYTVIFSDVLQCSMNTLGCLKLCGDCSKNFRSVMHQKHKIMVTVMT